MRFSVIISSIFVLGFAILIFHGCDESTSSIATGKTDTEQTDITVQNLTIPCATITVNTTDDELNSDGDCSLREAIQAANTDAPVDGCPGGCGDDLVIVPAGTYKITIPGRNENANATGDFDISSNLAIEGAGAATTIIDASGLDRIFEIRGSTAEISNLTVVNGETFGGNAGGIQNEGTLTVKDCIVSGNSGGDGGGIQNMFLLTVINTTVSDNVSDFGGGIGNSGGEILTLTNSTISNNIAEFGGGISNLGDKATLINCTISGNFASDGGGGMDNSGILELVNCTFTENEAPLGSGIYNYGDQVTLDNTIVAGNLSSDNCEGVITSLGYNLDSDGTCITNGVNNDITDVSPGLAVLQDNSGPTHTHALLPGSPAIDAGDCSDGTITTDQRGVSRPQGAGCDIGAFELITIITAEIDIKPGSFPNSINLKSKGVIPLAILTTANFDATTIDPLTVKFGPNGATESHGRGHIEDVDNDGDQDLVLHFKTQETGISCGETSASLIGETIDGQMIEGADSIKTVGCK